ncbi:MAG: fimbrillin family protein, partial [Duncaniella sp.]|nr:fimbrillin family protein [Duncaniella sp.]
MKKIFLLAVATLALMASCDNNDNPAASMDAAVITATIGECTPSRAVDTQWSRGDVIGISSIVGTEEPIVVGPFINLKYTTQEADGKFTGTPLY